ncbi:MAG TPA: recombinase family protein [Candidatus Paceibacterota bacterium]|nr:recombinase family protein [Candidatus Paceibacterota bacterium]HRT55081.1 recombinase family protein [Candidatus Paceibacterota bacterium]
MKTYLYNRVSSGKQSRTNKDGLTRQSESSEVLDFLKRHKLNVVKTMEYIGSSFTGKNFDNKTVLGEFVAAVTNGTIKPPVCLCFENWDRFGRDVEWKNTKRFLDLIEAGVSIGVVSMDIVIDQNVLAENSSILQLVVNDIQRARKESQRKSGFSKRNLAVKVANAKKGMKVYFGGQSPRWITGVKDGEFVLDTQMIANIERIFDLYLGGKSCVGIAKIMNGERKQTFGPSKKNPTDKRSKVYWFNTTVKNILTHKSLTGWCKVNDFESDSYYPEIIKPAVFVKVQSRVAHNATKRGGSKLGKVPNLFRGLICCARCENDIGVRRARVKKQEYSYMACRKSQVGICGDKTIWKMNELEERIFAFALEMTPDEMTAKPIPKANEDAVAKLKLELSNTTLAIKSTLGRLQKFPDLQTEIDAELTKLDIKRKTLREQIAKEESNNAVIAATPVAVAKFKSLLRGEIDDDDALTEAADSIAERLRDEEVRWELRNVMPDFIKKIRCDLSKWKYEIEFVNGGKKHFVFDL